MVCSSGANALGCTMKRLAKESSPVAEVFIELFTHLFSESPTLPFFPPPPLPLLPGIRAHPLAVPGTLALSQQSVVQT